MEAEPKDRGAGHRALAMGLTCVRWTARAVGLLVIGMVVAFAICEGFNPADLEPSEQLATIAFGTTLVGLGVAWHRELLGGLLVIGGMAAFGILGVAADGEWGWSGPVFWTIFVLGFAFAACGMLSADVRGSEDG